VRQRQHLVTSLVTGVTVSFTEMIDDEATLEQRVAGLKASAAAAIGRDPAEMAFLAAWCDSCGTMARVDYADPALPPGWESNADGELCPACKPTAG
jgi:hypothetical protein